MSAPRKRVLVRSKEDGDLMCIRDAEWVAKLPDDERKACAALWADVDALLARAQAAAPDAPPK